MADEDALSRLASKLADVEAFAKELSRELDQLRAESAAQPQNVEPVTEGVDLSLKWFKEDTRLQLEVINKKLHQVWPPREAASSDGGAEAETCTTASPDTVGSNAEGSESANSTAWVVADGPLDFWVTSRVGYFHAGDSKLYGYVRKLSLNSCGKGYALSAETRYEIDAPETCTGGSGGSA